MILDHVNWYPRISLSATAFTHYSPIPDR
jgi:hypothetical protein